MTRPQAFVHVDLDNLWAIAECYGLQIAPEQGNLVLADALPRLRALFQTHKVRATLFVVGRDLEDDTVVAQLRELRQDGHAFANHGTSHSLRFRKLSETEITAEVERTEELLVEKLGIRPIGFRAPGYGVSPRLLRVLTTRRYRYDSSLMPSPYGPLFRLLDRRMSGATAEEKTQYSLMGEARAPLRPYRIAPDNPLRETPGAPLIEYPAATSPFLRLPFQAGVCMRLGMRYFRANLRAYRRRPELPLLLLLHAADAADFNSFGIPFFSMSRFFNMAVERKLELLGKMLQAIRDEREVGLLDEQIGRPE